MLHAEGLYVNVGAGYATTFSSISADRGNKNELSLGYQFADSAFAVEMDHFHLGSFKIKDSNNGEVHTSGVALAGIWRALPERDPANVYVKLGLYSLEADLKYTPSTTLYSECPEGDCSHSSNGALIGVGGTYSFVNNFGIFAEVDVFPSLDCVVDKTTAAIAVAGLRIKF